MFRVVNSACPPILPFLVPVTLPQRVCLHSHTAQDEGKTYVEEEPKAVLEARKREAARSFVARKIFGKTVTPDSIQPENSQGEVPASRQGTAPPKDWCGTASSDLSLGAATRNAQAEGVPVVGAGASSSSGSSASNSPLERDSHSASKNLFERDSHSASKNPLEHDSHSASKNPLERDSHSAGPAGSAGTSGSHDTDEGDGSGSGRLNNPRTALAHLLREHQVVIRGGHPEAVLLVDALMAWREGTWSPKDR